MNLSTWKPYIYFFLPWPIFAILNFFFFKLPSVEFGSMVFWYYYLLLIGINFLPLTQKLFPKNFHGSIFFGKMLAILLLFYSDWILAHIQILPSREARLILVLIGFLTLINWKFQSSNQLQEIIKKNSRPIFVSEFLFFFIVLLFLALRSLSPEIYWGEKPMDFTLLNFMNRNPLFPVEDPWFSGGTMRYYYLGYYLYSGLIKVSGVKEEVGYALAVATSAGLFTQSIAGIIFHVSKKISLTVFGSLLIALGSHWNTLWRFSQGGNLNMDFFWKSTRLFRHGEFAEFPFWSFLFADLHPHMMSYAWSIFLLVIMINYWNGKERWGISNFFLLAMVWGSLLAINGWDFIIMSLYCLFISLFYVSTSEKKKYQVKKFLTLGLALAGALFLYLPMLWILSGGESMGLSIHTGPHNKLGHYFGHQGHWWVVILICAFPIFRKLKLRRLFSMHGHTQLMLALIVSTIALNLISETVIFHDRYNSVFKFGNLTYVFWGLLAIFSLRPSWFIFPWKYRLQTHMLAIFILAPTVLGSYLNAFAYLSYNPFGTDRPSLYGSRYLKKMNPGDYEVVSWIRKNVFGTPTLLEAYGPSFDHRAARVSMHTGLPTYLGWTGHVKLRGAKGLSIEKRKQEVDFIYNSSDAFKAHEILTRNSISFVIVGPYEVSQYNPQGLAKFDQFKELFFPLFSWSGSKLYGVGNFKDFTEKN